MRRKRVGSSILSVILAVTITITNVSFIKAEKKEIERIEVSYLLGEWVDCSQPLNKDFITIKIYYKDGSSLQKQGVGTVYPYILVPGGQTKIQVEYEGMLGEFFVWGKEENEDGSVIPTVTPLPTVSVTQAVTALPSKAPVSPTPSVSKNCYELISGQKGIFITKKAVRSYSVYANQDIFFVLGTNNINKIEYQFVIKGKKRTDKWKNMKNSQVVLRKQGAYILYLRFTTIAGRKIIKHTNGFVLDKAAPIISGVKNKRIYQKKVTISYKDKLSGIKKATINGETFNKKTTIKKNGTYTVEVVDKAKNKKSLEFTVSIPTPTPKPVPTLPVPSTSEPEAEPTYIPVTEVTALASLSVSKGKTNRISYQVTPSNATNQKVTFTSTNKKIVTVSGDGTVKGIQTGVASVIIRSQSDTAKYAVCVVYVR